MCVIYYIIYYIYMYIYTHIAGKPFKYIYICNILYYILYQGYILSPCLFNLYAEYIMRNSGRDEAQAGIKIAGRNMNNLRYADDNTLMAESK